MDNLTHSLVGAVLGQAGLKRTTGLAMPALIIGANLPDVDAACFFWLEGTEHLAFRRGITHGPPALVLLPLVLAGLLWAFDRWQAKRGTRPEGRLPVRFGWLYAMAFVGCLSHPFFDWLNAYGIRLLEPFSSEWFYGDTLFIIDPWLWALLIGFVWWSRRREKAGGDWARAGRIGVAAVLAYVGVNGAITALARQAIPLHEPYPQVFIASPGPSPSGSASGSRATLRGIGSRPHGAGRMPATAMPVPTRPRAACPISPRRAAPTASSTPSCSGRARPSPPARPTARWCCATPATTTRAPATASRWRCPM